MAYQLIFQYLLVYIFPRVPLVGLLLGHRSKQVELLDLSTLFFTYISYNSDSEKTHVTASKLWQQGKFDIFASADIQ